MLSCEARWAVLYIYVMDDGTDGDFRPKMYIFSDVV